MRKSSQFAPFDGEFGMHSWTYDEAFSRNRGLIAPAEQDRLRASCVAIPGMGGVGGIHLITLARLGIGAFRIIDPDTFDVVNFNRQMGAEIGTLGRSKSAVMAGKAREVNPELKLEVFDDAIDASNVDRFLEGADVLVDGIDFFAFEARRLLFRKARERGIWAVTAGPIGFSTAWLAFDPAGMTFDDYFDLRDGMAPLDQFVAFLVGLTPRATHRGYFDFSQVDTRQARGPSVGLACQLASGVVGAEVLKILLKRGPLRPAPHFFQFDAYRGILRHGRLRAGNRGLVQRLKRAVLRRYMVQLGFTPEKTPPVPEEHNP